MTSTYLHLLDIFWPWQLFYVQDWSATYFSSTAKSYTIILLGFTSSYSSFSWWLLFSRFFYFHSISQVLGALLFHYFTILAYCLASLVATASAYWALLIWTLSGLLFLLTSKMKLVLVVCFIEWVKFIFNHTCSNINTWTCTSNT